MAGRKATAATLIAALTLGTAGAAGAATSAINLFYQRAVMAAANSACRLFAPDVASALAAAKAQARGAALRSGADAATLASIESRATYAVGVAGCASPTITAGAAQVRSAFDGYVRLAGMDFPGELAGWSAARPAADGLAHWRVSQHDRFGWDDMTFGIVGHGAARHLAAVASFSDGAEPYGARLILRDAAATSGPYLNQRAADMSGRIPMDARLPPQGAVTVFNAEAMSSAGSDLRAPGVTTAWAFRFPAAAADALASLDPRETVAVEFLFPGDDGQVRRAYVEVGDFAAARAFASINQR